MWNNQGRSLWGVVLLESILMGARLGAQGWGLYRHKTTELRPSSESELTSSCGLVLHFSAHAQFPLVPTGSSLLIGLVACSGSGARDQLPQVGVAGLSRRWCLAFLCFQSPSWWKASNVFTIKEHLEPCVIDWFHVLTCFEKLHFFLLEVWRVTGTWVCMGGVPLPHVIFRTCGVSSFLPESYRHCVPDSVPSAPNSVP